MQNTQSSTKQYILDKLGLDRYQLKPQYAPKMTLCIVAMSQWQPELRKLGDSILAAVAQYCPDCHVLILESAQELVTVEQANVIIAEQDLASVTSSAKLEIFVIEDLLHNAAQKRRLWQSCFYG